MTKFKTLAAVLLAVSCLGVTAAYAQMKPQTQEQIVQNYDQTQKNKQLQTCFSAGAVLGTGASLRAMDA